jgi:hypothetical protein
MALVLSLMKVFDPTSTVTGGESATAQNAPGVPDGIRAQYNNLFGGGRLSDNARAQLVTAARQRYGQEYDAFGQRVEHYTKVSKQYGVEPGRVINDTRDPEFAKARAVQRASPADIMQMNPGDLRTLPPAALADLSLEQLQALRERLRRTAQPQGGK